MRAVGSSGARLHPRLASAGADGEQIAGGCVAVDATVRNLEPPLHRHEQGQMIFLGQVEGLGIRPLGRLTGEPG